MSNNQYTQKSMEAIQTAQRMASERGHQQLEQAHLLLALLESNDGLIPQMLNRMGVNTDALRQGTESILQKLPQAKPVSASKQP